MRADMHKVIVERPRHGGTRERGNRRANVPFEDRPIQESMRASHTDRKYFGENLAPLRRWLRAQVGRPWDWVYSEACSVIKPDSTVRNHIKVHLLEMVERHTFLKNGEVWCFRHPLWNTSEVPVAELGGGWAPFYVHPRSGILCEAQSRRRQPSWFERQSGKLIDTCRWLDSATALLNLNGCWFKGIMSPFPTDDAAKIYDHGTRAVLDCRAVQIRYGKRAFCVGKRQLSRHDLKRYSLKNSPVVCPP